MEYNHDTSLICQNCLKNSRQIRKVCRKSYTLFCKKIKGKILEEKQKSYRTEMVSPIWMVPSLMTLVKIPWVGMMHLPTFC